ncbi:hypothetical protein AVEN_189154-1 [Araneus ventricosus]|uniref:Uncharacterized protein n=1 Tax=Araneus ventricosus TaxID=182803 RepID=A0A4Y2NKV7_ARAVE|nr:hypothetical protein AVEN_189154-1 [Araneus ventricosus]
MELFIVRPGSLAGKKRRERQSAEKRAFDERRPSSLLPYPHALDRRAVSAAERDCFRTQTDDNEKSARETLFSKTSLTGPDTFLHSYAQVKEPTSLKKFGLEFSL